MTSPRFQFTIRGLMWATFWAAVSMGAWSIIANSDNTLVAFVFILPAVLAPFMSIGALFSRTVDGLLCGITAICICLMIAAVSVPFVGF